MSKRGLEESFNWYEATLPTGERKKRGHFSTPLQLVEQILDACGYRPEADLSQVRVLDPACGSGNFLAGITQRLLNYSIYNGLPQRERIALLQRNVWGFDPDPISCFLAEMRLRSILDDGGTPLGLHIHQADGLTLPWEPCIDLFVANPPYLAAKNNDLSGYRFTQQRGQTDSYLLFLNLAFRVVRPGGWIGLVLPDPVLARANAAKERVHLLNDFTLHHIWHLSDVFAAEVGAAVIIAQKKPAKSTHQVSWMRGRWYTREQQSCSTTTQALFLRQPGAEFRYLLGTEYGTMIERLRTCLDESSSENRRFAVLGEFLAIRRGEELGRESSYLIQHQPSPGELEYPSEYYPVLRGGVDIHAYSAPVTNWWIDRRAIKKPLERYLSPKLLVVKSTDRLQATLDMRGHVVLQTLYLLQLRNQDMSEDTLYFFLALLNSRLLQEYVYVLHTAYKWVQPQIEQSVLARLPVPVVVEPEIRQHIINQAKQLACSVDTPVVEWKGHFARLYEEQECAVRALYDSSLP